MSCDGSPELSVVVPVYNEEANLPALAHCLESQRGVFLELILCDGGSSDGTLATAGKLARTSPLPIRILSPPRGRARQMNAGAAAARAATLLFLHADSRFADSGALRGALDALAAEGAGTPTPRLAGHFPLRFDFPGKTPLPYRYYELKARLDRPGCTHGDQGMLIDRSFFESVGPFPEYLPLMEDTELAERVRQTGRWLLLPAPIFTSPRRFEREGLLQRQTLNAVLMTLRGIGRLDLIEELRAAYRTQDQARRLALRRFLVPLRRRLAQLPTTERRDLWFRTGAYVRGNAWQIPFFLDVVFFGEGKGRFLALHDRFFDGATANVAGNRVAAALAWLWFRLTTLWLRVAC